ncbi:carbohydrate-binding protein [Roseibium sp. RKSG952]|uniref:carbohydrate-binding protein n=1 Tax=Roseibium sp. RKSG952 TaxID=2529384 RepID=UPI0018AD18AB|nr:carbohydrate-binding protein [Roseibium sp. RKSG952]
MITNTDFNNVQNWDPNATYTSGDFVRLGDTIYRANWWTMGNDPNTANGGEGTGEPWTSVGTAGENNEDTDPTGPGNEDGGNDNSGNEADNDNTSLPNAWSSSAIYTQGDVVVIGNAVYQANWWTRGNDPANTNGGPGSGQPWTYVGPADEYDPGTGNGNGTPDNGTGDEPDGNDNGTGDGNGDAGGDNGNGDAGGNNGNGDDTGGDNGQTGDSSGYVYSPYVHVTTEGGGLADLAQNTGGGLEAITLAFALAGQNEALAWDGQDSLAITGSASPYADEISALQNNGVDVTISFGGAVGSYVADQFNDAQALADAYQTVIDSYNVNRLDFDIEGPALYDTATNDLRNDAIKLLQDDNPDLMISYTLPVVPDGPWGDAGGLTAAGQVLLASAEERGVDLEYVNIMTMNYGPYYWNAHEGGNQGYNAAVSAAERVMLQMEDLGIESQVMLTPMIGVNDMYPTDGEQFLQQDAELLTQWALQNQEDVYGLSMWSISRDQAGAAGQVSPTHSGLTDGASFSDIFNATAGQSDTSVQQTSLDPMFDQVA